MTLSDRMRFARRLADISLRELAELAGLSPAYPAHIEAGRREDIGADVASKLADVLGVTLDWLLRGLGHAPTREQVRAAVDAARARRESKPSSGPEAA